MISIYGSFLDRGIGWYLDGAELIEEVQKHDTKFFESNPGNWIGLGIASIYVLWPADVIPDVIPVIGYADDLIVARRGWTLGGRAWDLFFS